MATVGKEYAVDGLLHQVLDRSNALPAVITAATLFLSYVLVQAIYNIFFHPLKKYPGPTLAACTALPLIVATGSGNRVAWTHSLHTKYGEVVRVAPNELSYADGGQGWKDIYGHRIGGKASNQKDLRFYTLEESKARSIINSDDAGHGRQRRVFANAFSDKALKEQEAMFGTYVSMLVRKMKEVGNKDGHYKFDMVKLYNLTTFDVMGDLTFGDPLGLLENMTYTPWVEAIYGGVKVATLFQAMMYIPILFKVLQQLIPPSLKKKRADLFKSSDDRVDKRMARETSQPDIWNLVLRAKEEKGLSRDEMYANAVIFMIAGTETTATLLSVLTFYLLKNPEKMQKLVEEIRDNFRTEEDITMERLAKLKYLNACLEEGLRMYPPVPIGLPRVTPAGGQVIAGEWVPPQTTVYVSQYASYRNPENFRKPFSFIPERWTGDEEFASDKRAAFQPFSTGPRNCIGKNMAYHEMRLILATTLWHFDFTLCQESDNWADQKVFTLWDKRPLMVQLTPVVR